MNKPKRKSKVFPRGLRRIDILVIATVIMGIARLVSTLIVNEVRPPGIAFVIFFPFICPIVVLILIGLLVVAVKDGQHIFEILGLLLLAFFIVAALPMPERGPLPETLHFEEYRSDYEAVVELAKSGVLEHDTNCVGYLIHAEYAHVSSRGCISVDNNANEGLRVMFDPLSALRPLVYSERHPAAEPCGYDLRVEQQIDINWFVCWYMPK